MGSVDRDLGQRSDADLLIASSQDAAAFGELYRRWATKLLSYFYRRTWDPEASADLMAETFAVAFTKRRKYVRTVAPGGAWLYGIADRELKSYLRKASVEKRALRRLGVEVPRLDDESLARIDDLDEVTSLRSALVDALASLSDRERDAIRLRVVDELPFREVAEELGCIEGAARVRVHRGLQRLAHLLEESNDG